MTKPVEFPNYDKDKKSDVCPTCTYRAYTKTPSVMLPMDYSNPCIICLWNVQLVKTNNFVKDEKRKIIA